MPESENPDRVTAALRTVQGMSDEDWRRLIEVLKEIDPEFFRAPTNPLTGETIIPNGVIATRPPRHDTGA
ncbi:hypothetical protein ACFQ15_00705 [Sphingomonas hankookensis]|uniref:hypothetical protein n=1 Tax=Sphingomonas hankookensis TaxID=563996 RepID=UPI001F59505E|nr:hypothetical protein [Sphingomonas hankookensis]